MKNTQIWWHKPTLRTDADEGKERKATWLELFFDLIFVACVAVLAHGLAHELEVHPGFHSILIFAFLFVPVWWVWIGHTFYAERFETNDISHRTFTLLLMIAVAAMAYFAHEGLDSHSTVGFAWSYVAARSVIVIQWFRGAAYNPKAWPMVRIFNSLFIASIVLFAISTFVEPPVRYVFWGLALTFEFLGPIAALKTFKDLPKMSRERIHERYGLFTTLVLGESVAGAVNGAAKAHHLTTATATAGILGIVLAFALWFIYFDQIMNGRMRKFKWSGMIRSYLHLPLLMGLTAIGAGVLSIVGHEDAHVADSIRWLLCGSTAFSFLAFLAFELFFEGYVDDMKVPRPFLLSRVFCAIAALLTGWLGFHLNAVWIMAILVILALVQVILGMLFWVRAVVKKGEGVTHGWSL